jgi:hypothetical protein
VSRTSKSLNMVIGETGAATCGQVLPVLKGKLTGNALPCRRLIKDGYSQPQPEGHRRDEVNEYVLRWWMASAPTPADRLRAVAGRCPLTRRLEPAGVVDAEATICNEN